MNTCETPEHECDCDCEVVPYNGLKGVGYPENMGRLWWPECATVGLVQEHKLDMDILAGRVYKGARR